MKEDFLHYLWKFKKFRITGLKTIAGEDLLIISPGQYLERSGPDFFNAQIIINDQKWAGNIEIHLKSSDWYAHQHHLDKAYDNVILHVVWEHDSDIMRVNNTTLPVVQLRDYVDRPLLETYRELSTPKNWIFCESQLHTIDTFIVENWLEQLFFMRLERKANVISSFLHETNFDWEAVLFYQLTKNFGLNANGEAFCAIAKTITYQIWRKESHDFINLEALLFGMAGLLDGTFEDNYPKELQRRFNMLCQKHGLNPNESFAVEFFKHRPDNFPTIRLSQLASLYANKHLFANIIEATSISELRGIFSVSVSEYWESHYQFDRASPARKKNLSRAFTDLLISNTIVPLRFAYAKSRGIDDHQLLITLLKDLTPDMNAIIEKFSIYGLKASNAFESQALLELKNEYCNYGKCLGCAIGNQLLKASYSR